MKLSASVRGGRRRRKHKQPTQQQQHPPNPPTITPRESSLNPRQHVVAPPALDNDFVVGTCSDMCSKQERDQRQANGELCIYEMVDRSLHSTSFLRKQHKAKPTTTAQLAVKKFRRSAAGRDQFRASELRPSFVLLKTTKYLVDLISKEATDEHTFAQLYHFISDRMRAVRQDFTVQALVDDSLFECLLLQTRFHVVANYMLATEHNRTFDTKLAHEQLVQAMSMLVACILESRADGNTFSDAQIESLSYWVVAHLDDSTRLGHMLTSLPEGVLQDARFRAVLKLVQLWYADDFSLFLRLLAAQPTLVQCLAARLVPAAAIAALGTFNKAYMAKAPISGVDLDRMLSLRDTTRVGEAAGLAADSVGLHFKNPSFDPTASRQLGDALWRVRRPPWQRDIVTWSQVHPLVTGTVKRVVTDDAPGETSDTDAW